MENTNEIQTNETPVTMPEVTTTELNLSTNNVEKSNIAFAIAGAVTFALAVPTIVRGVKWGINFVKTHFIKKNDEDEAASEAEDTVANEAENK